MDTSSTSTSTSTSANANANATTITTIGIVGAGTMGHGIAQACAVHGLDVVMIDIEASAVERGMASISASLERLVKKDKLKPADKDAALARIRGSTDDSSLLSAQLVIEAATESEALKQIGRAHV